MAEEIVNIGGTDFENCLENAEFPESVMEKIEAALERMKSAPGGSNEKITLVIANDFEAEDEESEDEDETEGDEE